MRNIAQNVILFVKFLISDQTNKHCLAITQNVLILKTIDKQDVLAKKCL